MQKHWPGPVELQSKMINFWLSPNSTENGIFLLEFLDLESKIVTDAIAFHENAPPPENIRNRFILISTFDLTGSFSSNTVFRLSNTNAHWAIEKKSRQIWAFELSQRNSSIQFLLFSHTGWQFHPYSIHLSKQHANTRILNRRKSNSSWNFLFVSIKPQYGDRGSEYHENMITLWLLINFEILMKIEIWSLLTTIQCKCSVWKTLFFQQKKVHFCSGQNAMRYLSSMHRYFEWFFEPLMGFNRICWILQSEQFENSMHFQTFEISIIQCFHSVMNCKNVAFNFMWLVFEFNWNFVYFCVLFLFYSKLN